MNQERETAKTVVDYLQLGVETLDGATAEKLAAARQRAVAAMPEAVQATHAEVAHAGLGHVVHQAFHGRNAWMAMLATMALLLMVLALISQNTTMNGPVEADALLLASELPPEAYLDKGFDAWLESTSEL